MRLYRLYRQPCRAIRGASIAGEEEEFAREEGEFARAEKGFARQAKSTSAASSNGLHARDEDPREGGEARATQGQGAAAPTMGRPFPHGLRVSF